MSPSAKREIAAVLVRERQLSIQRAYRVVLPGLVLSMNCLLSTVHRGEEWDKLVEDHAAPNILLVAVDANDTVIGFTAAHPHDCEMFLLFVHPDRARRRVRRQLLEAALE